MTGTAYSLCALNKLDNIFLTCGERKFHSFYQQISHDWNKFKFVTTENLRIWKIDKDTHKLHVLNVSLGKIRRNFTSMKICGDDSIMYAGTMSGDVVKVRLNCCPNQFNKPTLIGCYARHNPRKSPGKDCEKYMNGVRDLLYLDNERRLLIGAGDGTIELVEERNVQIRSYPSPTWPLFKAVLSYSVLASYIRHMSS